MSIKLQRDIIDLVDQSITFATLWEVTKERNIINLESEENRDIVIDVLAKKVFPTIDTYLSNTDFKRKHPTWNLSSNCFCTLIVSTVRRKILTMSQLQYSTPGENR